MFLERMFEKRDGMTLNDPPEWLMSMFGGRETSSGEKISPSNALSHVDVFACVQILADDIAKLPIKVFKKSNDTIQKKEDHGVARVLYRQPNQYMTAFTFKKLMMTHLCLTGNAYAYISRDKNGKVKYVLPLHPSNTQARVDPMSGLLWYETIMNSKRIELIPDEVLHYKGMTDDGIHGKSPITVIREQVGAQSAATKYNAKFYGNDATPRGVLKAPTQLKKEAKDEMRNEWKKVNQGEDIAVVDAGLDYTPISMNMDDAQFVESMKFNKLQIANIFKIPPHKVNDLDGGTYSNVEMQSLGYLIDTLQPWITAIEQENDVKLFSEMESKRGYYTKFNVNSILRADMKTRAEYYKTMLEKGVYSINQILALEEMNGIEGGDEHRVDLNHISLSIADEYQMTKASNGLKGGDDNEQGNSGNDNEN